MAIDGHRSSFPGALDDWGNEYENNACQRWTADRWNWIQDAVYALEQQTQYLLLAGDASHPAGVESFNRPRMLVKAVVAVLTGSAAEVKDFTMPAFTAAEKALFGGEPLNPLNTLTLQARILTKDNVGRYAYVASLRSPLTDYSGDSGWQVSLSPLRDSTGDAELKVGAGTYVITVMINR